MHAFRWLFAACLLLPIGSFAQAPGDVRSHQSGVWQDASTWERFDGSQWVTPAPAGPTASDGAIIIRSTDTVSVDADVSVDQLTVMNGAVLVMEVGKVLTVADGSDAVDLAIEGTVRCCGTISALGAARVGGNGKYIHAVPAGGGAILTAEWQTGSTCEVDSAVGTTSPSNITAQSFHHFIWNSPRQSGNIGLNFPDGYRFRGSLTVRNTGGGQWRLTNLSAGQTKTVNIDGDVVVDGASALLTGTGSGADTNARVIVRVGGSIRCSAGSLGLTNSSNATGEWIVAGDIVLNGGILTSGGSRGARARILHFAGPAATVTLAGPSSTPVPITIVVDTGAVVQLGSPWTITGEFRLSGGRAVTSPTSILTIASGGAVTGGSAGSYIEGPIAVVVASTVPAQVTFPLGIGSAYRPVTLRLQHDAATATTYTARLIAGPPPARTLPPALRKISSLRHLSLTKGNGAGLSTNGASIELTYGVDDSVSLASIVRIAKDDGAGAWLNLGGSGTGVPNGSITSNVFLTFSDFVLAEADTLVAAVLPTVTTSAADRLSTNTFRGGGAVTNDGGAAIMERGLCWSSAAAPTIADPHTSDGAGAGGFISSVTGLTPGTLYHVRSYATNSAGTGYGPEIQVTTLASLTLPSVITGVLTDIVGTRATVAATVTFWGGVEVTERGVCWNTGGTPTIADANTSKGSGEGAFSVQLSGLTLGTRYYARPYATNSVGTAYGDEVSFTTPAPLPDLFIVVDGAGSGQYTTVQSAFIAVPDNYTGTTTIFVKKGVYKEKLLLASSKMNVVLRGEDRDSTILTYDDYSGKTPSIGTSTSYSLAIDASDFVATDITIQNTATEAQAVALRTNGDRQSYYRCNILGYQDTYYTWGGSAVGRIYNQNCLIRGSVDFIFGRNVVVFDSCSIIVNRNGGTVTAASTEPATKFGYVFCDCQLSVQPTGFDGNAVTSFYLGRPWQSEPRTVFLRCSEPTELNAAGWLAWNVTPALYAEYQCTGTGFRPAERVAWSAQLTDSQASTYTLANIFSRNTSPVFGSDWLPVEPPVTTAVGEMDDEPLPGDPALLGNYPNPFNPSTKIEFQTAQSGPVRLVVLDLLGREIARLLDSERPAGRYTVEWKADSVSGGVYVIRLEGLNAQGAIASATRKVVLLR